jgi:hypothetical protein
MGGGRFSDGFLMGALVGGAAVFLLGTKKGNKVLQAITEEGIEGLSDFIEAMEEKEVVPRAEKKAQEIVSEVKEKVEDTFDLEDQKTPASNGSSKPKRFFKKK